MTRSHTDADKHRQSTEFANDQAGPRLCYLMGILQRSGTNFLYRLIKQHPACSSPGPIWEDFLLYHSEHLEQYINGVERSWNPAWRVDQELAARNTLYLGFGRALWRLLSSQLDHDESTKEADGSCEPQYLLSKTPSASGCRRFHAFFPDAPLVIIVRDGRNLISSGMKSFGWHFEAAARAWRDNARLIHQAVHSPMYPGRILLVRYEDLYGDQAATLTQVLAFLDLDPNSVEVSRDIGVTGSSELADAPKGVHWQPRRKSETFDPLERHHEWTGWRRQRFNWLAGREMLALGYEVPASGPLAWLMSGPNLALDALWFIRQKVKRLLA